MLEKFTVIDLLRTHSDSVATVSGNYIKFNHQTIVELGYPAFIQFLILEKKNQFGIRVCKEDTPCAVKFSKPAGEQKGQIRLCVPAVTALVRRMTGWSVGEAWNVPGIFLAEENGIVYDVNAAYPPVHRNRAKGEEEAASEDGAAEAEDAPLEGSEEAASEGRPSVVTTPPAPNPYANPYRPSVGV